MATVLWQQLGQDINGQAAQDQSGSSTSLSANGMRVAIGSPFNDGGTGNPTDYRGSVRVYQVNNGSWVQVGQIINGEAAGDLSGRSVSLNADGSRLAIGATANDGSASNSGQVRVYKFDTTTLPAPSWVQIGQDINGEAAGDLSGTSVSLSADGTRVAIGAPLNDANGINSGQVRIYGYNGTSWVQIGQDIDGESANDQSGRSVSLSADGTRVAIGATSIFNDGNTIGQVRIYAYNGTSWVQIGQDIDGEAAFNESGRSVSLSADGTRVAIGAPGNNSGTGRVRIYGYNGTSWVQIGSNIDGKTSFDLSGRSVSLTADGTRVAIGSPFNGINRGQVRIYEYNGTNWVQISQDIDGETDFDQSGTSVSLSADGTRVAIGSLANDNNGDNSGQVRVFEIPPPEPSPVCYARGTLIATSRGMVSIEDLLMSDKLRTYDRIEESIFKSVHGLSVKTLTRVKDTRFKNRFGHIKFIGKFTVNIINEHTAPIRITANALGENKPEIDLLVSPNHSMLVGNRLIFAKNLVNGTTIYQDMSFKKIEYFHVLSDDHYIINANGALSETLGSEEIAIFESLHSFPDYIESPLETNTKYKFKTVNIKEDVDLLKFDSIAEYSFTEIAF